MAQLGARFHGMEEVVGSIPTRSTKSLNNLDREFANRHDPCCHELCHDPLRWSRMLYGLGVTGRA